MDGQRFMRYHSYFASRMTELKKEPPFHWNQEFNFNRFHVPQGAEDYIFLCFTVVCNGQAVATANINIMECMSGKTERDGSILTGSRRQISLSPTSASKGDILNTSGGILTIELRCPLDSRLAEIGQSRSLAVQRGDMFGVPEVPKYVLTEEAEECLKNSMRRQSFHISNGSVQSGRSSQQPCAATDEATSNPANEVSKPPSSSDLRPGKAVLGKDAEFLARRVEKLERDNAQLEEQVKFLMAMSRTNPMETPRTPQNNDEMGGTTQVTQVTRPESEPYVPKAQLTPFTEVNCQQFEPYLQELTSPDIHSHILRASQAFSGPQAPDALESI